MESHVVGTGDVAKRLADRLGRIPHEAPPLTSFEVGVLPAHVVAVDGSSLVIAEAGDLLVGAHRSGRVRLDAGTPRTTEPQPVEVTLLSPEDGAAQVQERLRWAGIDAQVEPLAAGAALDALRTLGELAAAREALESLAAGDLLLLDGALTGRTTLPVLDALLARSAERGVDVVGVCKSTRLRLGPSPALVACQLAGRTFPSHTWLAPLPAPPSVRGRVHAARLSPGDERVFRFDIAARDGDAARVLGSVAALAGHPAYPGYPSPLAMAHNAALLNEETRTRIRTALFEATEDAGLAPEILRAAFADYHDILELGA